MTHYIRTATVLVLTLLLQCAAEAFPDFRPPPTDLHWRDAEAIAAYAFIPPPKAPPYPQEELPKPEDFKCSAGEWFLFNDSEISLPVRAPRVFGRVVSVRPYHFHSRDVVGCSVLVEMETVCWEFPKQSYCNIQVPDGWSYIGNLSLDWSVRFRDNRWQLSDEKQQVVDERWGVRFDKSVSYYASKYRYFVLMCKDEDREAFSK